MIVLEPYDPIDVDPSGFQPKLSVAYLVRYKSSRVAWLCCFDGHAILWWLPEDNFLAWPYFRHGGWSIASPYPDARYWFISGLYTDALEYISNGIRVHEGEMD